MRWTSSSPQFWASSVRSSAGEPLRRGAASKPGQGERKCATSSGRTRRKPALRLLAAPCNSRSARELGPDPNVLRKNVRNLSPETFALSDGQPSSRQCRSPCTGTRKTETNGSGAVSGNMPPLPSSNMTRSLASSRTRPCLTWLHASTQTPHREIECTSCWPVPGSMRSPRVRLDHALPALDLSHQTQFIYDSGTKAIGDRAFTSSCKALKTGGFFRVSAGRNFPLIKSSGAISWHDQHSRFGIPRPMRSSAMKGFLVTLQQGNPV